MSLAIANPGIEVDQLGDIADRIRAEWTEIEGALKSGIARAVTIGGLLAQVKSQLKHGKFSPWVERHCPFRPDYASKLMKLATRPELASMPNVKIGDAFRMLAASNDGPHVTHNSGAQEWYTPAHHIAAAVETMGAIDLDPCSTDVANTVVRATEYYDRETDGLTKDWHGRVWLNPPYAFKLIGRFADKLLAELANGNVTEAIALVNNATETLWFQALSDEAAARLFPAGRVRFWNRDPDAPSGTPLQGQAFLYFGDNPHTFCTRFGAFGRAFVPAKTGAA